MDGSIRERVTIKVSLVIAAVDDLNGRPVERNKLRAWIAGEPRPVAKEGGYFIFTDLRKTSGTIHLEGPVFHKQEIRFDREMLAQYEGKTMKVRMLPNRSYPIPRHTACVQGRAPAGCMVMAYNKTMAEPFKLLYPYDAKAAQIHIYHPEDADMEGRTFLIQDKEKQNRELLRVLERVDAEKGSCLLAAPLAHSYKKIGTVLYPVYASRADDSGMFYLPAAGADAKAADFVLWLEGQEDAAKEIRLESGRQARLDLL